LDELGERCFDDGVHVRVPLLQLFRRGYTAQGKQAATTALDSCDYSGFTREVSGTIRERKRGEVQAKVFSQAHYHYVKKDAESAVWAAGDASPLSGEVECPPWWKDFEGDERTGTLDGQYLLTP